VSDGALWSPLAAVTIHVTPADGPDEAPVPTPEPGNDPDSDPPCHGHVADNVLNALASAASHGAHARAVDAIFGHGRWHA
jgi:hypothetical protein